MVGSIAEEAQRTSEDWPGDVTEGRLTLGMAASSSSSSSGTEIDADNCELVSLVG